MHIAGGCELASLLVHRFQAVDSLCGPQFELLADQALIDCGPSRARRDHQLNPRCSQRAIERGQAWVGVCSLEPSNGRLADRQPPCELRLR